MAVFCLREEFDDLSAANKAKDQQDVELAKVNMAEENETYVLYRVIWIIGSCLWRESR